MKKRICTKVLAFAIAFITIFELCPYSTKTRAYSQDSDRVIVSLGDSYSSGEGIPDFYGQNDDLSKQVTNKDWLAHRSTKSWPGRLTLDGVGKMADNRNTHWFFVAASGAETKHLKNTQKKDYNKKFSTIEGTEHLPAQLDVFNTLESKNLKADYVTITIGGNDAGFTDILSDAVISHSSYLFPGVLTKRLNQTIAKFLTYDLTDTSTQLTIYSNLTSQEHLIPNFEITNVEFAESGSIYTGLCKAYEDIHEAAGEQAKIIVAGYPKLLNNASALTINTDEVSMINRAVSLFNYGINKLVTRYRETENMPIYFVSVEEAFEGHEAYSKNKPAINKIKLSPEEQDIDDRILKVLDENGEFNSLKKYPNPSAYSMHPNCYGAQIYAECVQTEIDDLEGKNQSSTPTTTQPTTNTSSDSFYNDQFYQNQQYNMWAGMRNGLNSIAYDDSTIYYKSYQTEFCNWLNSADDIMALHADYSDCYNNTSSDSNGVTIGFSDTCAVSDNHIYYNRYGQLCRLNKSEKTNCTSYINPSNGLEELNFTDEVIYKGDEIAYILSKKFIYIVDGTNLIRINLDGSNKKIIKSDLNYSDDNFRMFTINENLYYVAEGQLYCHDSAKNTTNPICNVNNDIYLQCASGNSLYFLRTELSEYDLLDDKYTHTIYKFTEGENQLTEYESVTTYGSGNIFVDPKGTVYVAPTAGGGTPVYKIENGKVSADNYVAFNMSSSMYIYNNSIIGLDFRGEKFITAYTF